MGAHCMINPTQASSAARKNTARRMTVLAAVAATALQQGKDGKSPRKSVAPTRAVGRGPVAKE